MVAGLACFNDPPSYADGSVVSGTASHARQVNSAKPDEEANRRSSRIAGSWALH